MGKISLYKYDLPTRSVGNGYSSIKAVSNQQTGFVPLLKLIDVYSGSNDYFNVKRGIITRNNAFKYINFESALSPISFYTHMRQFRGDFNTITNSMLSILGMKGILNPLISQGERRLNIRGDVQKIIITNPIDVMILAIIKASDLSKIKVNANTFEFDSKLITLLISEEKYKDRTFLDENYNKTVAKYLRSSVHKTVKEHSMKTEIVSDKVLEQYYKNTFTVENNSVFELMEIDKQIKEKVFPKINDNLMVYI